MTQTPSRDWQKDMAFILREKERVQIFHLDTKEEDIAIHWLQEAKERGRRERILKEALEHCIKEYPLYDSKEIGGSLMMDFMRNTLSIIYPGVPAQADKEA